MKVEGYNMFGKTLSEIRTNLKSWRPLTQRTHIRSLKNYWDAEFQAKCKEASWKERWLDFLEEEAPLLYQRLWKDYEKKIISYFQIPLSKYSNNQLGWRQFGKSVYKANLKEGIVCLCILCVYVASACAAQGVCLWHPHWWHRMPRNIPPTSLLLRCLLSYFYVNMCTGETCVLSLGHVS